MRTAVVRLDVDPERALAAPDVAKGLQRLAEDGMTAHTRPDEHEIELLVDSESPNDARRLAISHCERTFGTTPAVIAVAFVSRGTDEDALGVLEALGVKADLERTEENGEQVATFTIAEADRRRVPESRLHTALEAALNCEIRFRWAP